MARVLIVEKELLLKYGLEQFMRSLDGICVCNSPEDTVDLLLLGMSCRDSLSDLRGACPHAKVLLLSTVPAPECLSIARQLDADGLCFLQAGEETLLDTVLRILSGEAVFPRHGPVCALGSARSSDLTQRELSVLEYLVQGDTDAEIAEKLFISVRTVKSHIQSMREKTGLRNRTELAVRAGLCGLVLPRWQ